MLRINIDTNKRRPDFIMVKLFRERISNGIIEIEMCEKSEGQYVYL